MAADGEEYDRGERQEHPGISEDAQASALEHGAESFVQRSERSVERIGCDLAPENSSGGFVEWFTILEADQGFGDGRPVASQRGLGDEQSAGAAVLSLELGVDVPAGLIALDEFVCHSGQSHNCDV